MQQQSVLVFDVDNKRARVVSGKGQESNDVDFKNYESVSYFIDENSEAHEEIQDKIDGAISSIMGSNTTGWTLGKVNRKKVYKIGNKNYFPASEAIVMHGLTEKNVEDISKKLKDVFGKKILVRDLIRNTEKVV